jgi:hypothetical protein
MTASVMILEKSDFSTLSLLASSHQQRQLFGSIGKWLCTFARRDLKVAKIG